MRIKSVSVVLGETFSYVVALGHTVNLYGVVVGGLECEFGKAVFVGFLGRGAYAVALAIVDIDHNAFKWHTAYGYYLNAVFGLAVYGVATGVAADDGTALVVSAALILILVLFTCG